MDLIDLSKQQPTNQTEPMNDTPTPRTDANEYNEYQPNVYIEDIKVVNSALSRELERELTAAREALTMSNEQAARAWETLDVVTEQRDGLHELHNKNAARSKELLELCVTLRKHRDRLAEALEETTKHMRHSLNCHARIHHTHPCSCGMEKAEDDAREALAAVKGGSDES